MPSPASNRNTPTATTCRSVPQHASPRRQSSFCFANSPTQSHGARTHREPNSYPSAPPQFEKLAPSRVDDRHPRSPSQTEIASGRANSRAGRPLYFAPRQRKARSVRLRPRRGNATSVPTMGERVTAGKALAARHRANSLKREHTESCDESPIKPSRPANSPRPLQSPQLRGRSAAIVTSVRNASRTTRWPRLRPSGQRLLVSRS